MDRRIAVATPGYGSFSYAMELTGLAGPLLRIRRHDRRTGLTVAQ